MREKRTGADEDENFRGGDTTLHHRHGGDKYRLFGASLLTSRHFIVLDFLLLQRVSTCSCVRFLPGFLFYVT